MECKTFNTNSYETILTGDWHIGNYNVDKVALNKMIKYIEKSGCNWYFTGDACESTPHSHKNFDIRTIDTEFQGIGQEYAYFKKIIRPIASQCAGVISGNHDERNAKNSEIDILGGVCEDLEIPYLKNSAYSRLVYNAYGKSCSTLVYLIHGFSSSRQRGGKVNALENIALSHIADMYACGHTHDMYVTSNVIDTMSKSGNFARKYIYFGNTGTFLRSIVEGKESYAEKAGYRPNKVGYLRALFSPVTRTIKMEEVVM
jgi:predicted phosphodiesterase